MVSVLDIFARVMDPPSANKAGALPSEGGESGVTAGLLTFVEQFAEQSATPIAAAVSPEHPLTQSGDPVAQLDGLGQPPTSDFDVLSDPLAPDNLVAAVDRKSTRL